MIRTLAIRVYPNDDYSTPLLNTDTNAVRLMYAYIVGGNVIVGGAVPGSEFEHSGSGVWSRDVDTSLMDDNRTDYYYVQYRIKTGATWGEWENVDGFDPFFFNTKVLSGYASVKPSITSLVPSPITAEANAMSVVLTIPGTYASGGQIADGIIYAIEVALPGALTSGEVAGYMEAPEGLKWVSGKTQDSIYVIHRVGINLSMNCHVFYRYRAYNPGTMEYSGYSALAYIKLKSESAQELIDITAITPPATMKTGDVSDVDSWGKNDSIMVLTPQLGRGNSVNVAVQFGGIAPTISSGALVGFSGTEISTGQPSIIIPKPVSITGTLKVYVARRRVGLVSASDWIGASETVCYEIVVTQPDKLSLISPAVLEAMTTHIAGKLQTADGTALSTKS